MATADESKPAMQNTFDRTLGIGGSDVPAILGASPWRDRTDVWMEKTHHPAWRPKEVTSEMRWGTLLEPVLRLAYEEDTGRRVFAPGDKTYWADDRIRYAHLDGLIQGEGIWEAKVPFQTYRLWQGEPPVYVLAQVQHYLDITGEPWCDVSALLPGADFQTFRVPADPDAQAAIRKAIFDFWQHVESGEPPDRLPVAVEYPKHKSDLMVVADEEAESLVERLRSVRVMGTELDDSEEDLKDQLKRLIGDAAGMLGQGWRIRYKANRDSMVTDWKLVSKTWGGQLDAIEQALVAEDYDKARKVLTDMPRDTVISLYTTAKPGARPFVLEDIDQ